MSRMDEPRNDTQKRISFRVREDVLEAFDEKIDNISETDNRSELLRSFMNEYIERPQHRDATPLIPPEDAHLREAYQELVDLANIDGVIPDGAAERCLSGGVKNVSKTDVKRTLLKPLHQRGYITRRGNLYGDSAWKIVNWHGWRFPGDNDSDRGNAAAIVGGL